MNELVSRQPTRPFLWPEIVTQLQGLLHDLPESVYIVGGAVRDAWLNRPLHDLDLTTSGNAISLARQVANHFNGDFFILDSERGVGRALLHLPDGRIMVDVARFRADGLANDLRDRDFTVNAMAVDIKGNLSLLIDPLNGEADMTSRQIRRCSPNALRSDPVRILRAVRQSLQFGLRIEPETLRDIRAAISLLNNCSPERVRDEFFKLLSLPRVSAGLRVADSLGLIQIILPETAALHDVQHSSGEIDGWQHALSIVENLAGILATIDSMRTDNTTAAFSFGMIAIELDHYRRQLQNHLDTLWPNERPHTALLMLTALLLNETVAEKAAKIADSRAEALRLSNAERQRMTVIIQNRERILRSEEMTPIVIHNFWRRTGEAGIDICLLTLASFLGTHGPQLKQNDWLMLVERVRVLLEAWYEKHDQLVSPPVLVDGNQLMSSLDLKPGPIIRQLLDAIREAQVEGKVQTPEQAMNLAQSFLDEKSRKA